MKIVILFQVAILLSLSLAQNYPSAPFSKLNITKNDITVSGISSGAFFVDQLQVIYSSIITGSGSFAGGPFFCAQGQLTTGMISCMYATMQINVQQLVTTAKTYEQQGLIDPTSNLKNVNAWVQSGLLDTTVKQSVSQALQQFYQQMGVGNLKTNFGLSCAHNWLNGQYGNDCSTSQTPYIAKCSGNVIDEMLTQIYGGKRTIKSPIDQLTNNLFQFDQTTFASSSFTSLSNLGFAYIPKNCQDGKPCSIHFAFHGCLQDYTAIGDKFITQSHLNEYAEANDIVVIFPQVSVSNDYTHSNPNGCWDWWGYTDANYSNNKGVQNQFFRNMIKQIVGI